jgi:CBS domain containing-hemolysin-like protein
MEILIAIFLMLLIAFLSSGIEAGYLKSEKLQNFSKDNVFLTTTLFVNSLAINFGAIFFSLFIDKFQISENLKSFLEILLFTLIVLIFCETVPKSIAFYYPTFFYNKFLSSIYWYLSYIFYPFFKLFEKFFKNSAYFSERIIATRDILLPLRYIVEKEFWRQEKALIIQEIISFVKSDIRKFVKPKSEVQMISYNSRVLDVIELFKITGYRFFPVYKQSKEDIIGIIDVNDLINVNRNDKILKFIKKPIVLIDKFPALEFLRKNYNFAIVYDEFGNFIGIITRKEILRNIFNIYSPNIRKISENTYIIDKPIDLGLIEELTGIHLGDPNMNLNEFLMEKNFTDIQEGDEIVFENLKITILSKDGDYISKIKLEVVK